MTKHKKMGMLGNLKIYSGSWPLYNVAISDNCYLWSSFSVEEDLLKENFGSYNFQSKINKFFKMIL